MSERRRHAALLPRADTVALILALACVARLAEIAADIGYASPVADSPRRARTARALANAKILSNAAHPVFQQSPSEPNGVHAGIILPRVMAKPSV